MSIISINKQLWLSRNETICLAVSSNHSSTLVHVTWTRLTLNDWVSISAVHAINAELNDRFTPLTTAAAVTTDCRISTPVIIPWYRWEEVRTLALDAFSIHEIWCMTSCRGNVPLSRRLHARDKLSHTQTDRHTKSRSYAKELANRQTLTDRQTDGRTDHFIEAIITYMVFTSVECFTQS